MPCGRRYAPALTTFRLRSRAVLPPIPERGAVTAPGTHYCHLVHDQTPPLRFRTPPGWPTPSPEWVELFQGAEPTAGWSPAADVPPAPARWTFWVPTRALRRRVPRSALVLLSVGAAVTVASFVVAVVLWALGLPAVFALPTLVAGAALWVVGVVRYGDRISEAVAEVRAWSAARRAGELPPRVAQAHPDVAPDEALAAWDADAWTVPSARPFHEGTPSRAIPRAQHVLAGVTAGVAALVLLGGAVVAAVPAVDSVGQELSAASSTDGSGPSADDPSGGDDAPQPGWASDDGSIKTYWLAADDEWEATCDMTPGTTTCDPWEITSDHSCTAIVTVGFFASADDDQPSRIEERTVTLTKGVPLVLVENYDEEASDIGDVTCATGDETDGDRVTATQHEDTTVADADVPAGCDEEDCVAFAVTPSADCAAAAVQFTVDAAVGSLTKPHDVAVVTPLHAGKATDVFVGGTEHASDVHAGAVTCRTASDQPGYAANS